MERNKQREAGMGLCFIWQRGGQYSYSPIITEEFRNKERGGEKDQKNNNPSLFVFVLHLSVCFALYLSCCLSLAYHHIFTTIHLRSFSFSFCLFLFFFSLTLSSLSVHSHSVS